MKKTYINPNMDVVKLQMHQHLLDGSLTVKFGDTTKGGGEACGHDDDFDW
jgi:hypothetical protein